MGGPPRLFPKDSSTATRSRRTCETNSYSPISTESFRVENEIRVKKQEECDNLGPNIEITGASSTALQAVTNSLRFEEGVQQLSVGDMTIALIRLCPNLNHCSLQVDGFTTQDTLLYSSLGLGCATEIPRLALATLEIAHFGLSESSGNFLYIDQNAQALLDSCPCLDTLLLHGCGGIWSQNVKIPSLTKLKTLHITRSRMTAMDLSYFVSCCSSLRSFVYEAVDVRLSKERYPRYHASRIHFRANHAAQILRRHRATLESIHIDLRLLTRFPNGNLEDHRPPFSFRDFQALRHLFLNSTALYCPQLGDPSVRGEGILRFLPPGIVSLHLASGRDPVDPSRAQEGLLCLAKAVSQKKFPSLREVRCGRGDIPDDGSILSAAFAAAGVDFAYRYFSFF